jgi:hypothetical protein
MQSQPGKKIVTVFAGLSDVALSKYPTYLRLNLDAHIIGRLLVSFTPELIEWVFPTSGFYRLFATKPIGS